jgi:hypothetical protein
MSQKTTVFCIDPEPELRTALYEHWEGVLAEMSLVTGPLRSLARVVRGRYTAVLLPLMSASPEMPYLFRGDLFAQSVLAANPNYGGRFIFLATDQSLEWAERHGIAASDYGVILSHDPADGPGQLVEKGDDALTRSVDLSRTTARGARKRK